jgi:hypothetical protein
MGGHNWRSALGDYAAISGVLAGFSFALIVFILGSSLGNSALLWGVTWGQAAVLLTGFSSALFIGAAEFFLRAKEYDVWSLPTLLNDQLARGFKSEGKDWNAICNESDDKCELYESRGRNCYNIAIFTIFIAIGFVVAPYNLIIALGISVVGIIVELTQTLRRPHLLNEPSRAIGKVSAQTALKTASIFAAAVLGNFLLSDLSRNQAVLFAVLLTPLLIPILLLSLPQHLSEQTSKIRDYASKYADWSVAAWGGALGGSLAGSYSDLMKVSPTLFYLAVSTFVGAVFFAEMIVALSHDYKTQTIA